MILAPLPLPPLPVIVERLDDDGRVCEELLQTSHDLLSNLLLHACAKNSPADNDERKERQTGVLRSLVNHMANRGQLQSVPELYETYCHHTRLHACTYLPRDGKGPSMRFAPLASVCKGDATHRRMCDYMAGQAIILEEPNGTSAQDWLCREYADMLSMARQRLLLESVESPGQEQTAPETADQPGRSVPRDSDPSILPDSPEPDSPDSPEPPGPTAPPALEATD